MAYNKQNSMQDIPKLPETSSHSIIDVQCYILVSPPMQQYPESSVSYNFQTIAISVRHISLPHHNETGTLCYHLHFLALRVATE